MRKNLLMRFLSFASAPLSVSHSSFCRNDNQLYISILYKSQLTGIIELRLRNKFEEIARHIGGNYKYHQTTDKSILSNSIPTSFHHISLDYRSAKINLTFEFGDKNTGKVKSKFLTSRGPEIHINTKNHFQRLFSKNRNPFEIKVSNHYNKYELTSILKKSSYENIVKNTSFEPKIKGNLKANNYHLLTTFYLGFDDKELSVIPSINVHQHIIDMILGKM